MKLRLLGAVCALFLSFSASTNAAVILPDSDFGGNVVVDNGSGFGLTNIDISFNSMNPIWLHFDNSLLATDDISINSIANNTGIPWADFHFEFLSATIAQSIGITPLTGQISSIDLSNPDAVWIFFDPAFPETEGFINGQGIINTSLSADYWLHIAPTAVPVPAAVWLFGSGTLGLIGVARRKKAA